MRNGTKCKTIVDALSDEIAAGRYRAPSSFPSAERIIRRFKVSYLTAVRALDELKRRGLVYSVVGSGTFVSKTASRSLGLMVPAWPGTDFFPALCREISSLCQVRGRPLLFADTSGSEKADGTLRERLVAAARSFVAERVAGVFYHPVDFGAEAAGANAAVLDVFRAAEIPVALLDCDIASPPDESGNDLVGIDNESAGWRLGDHVLSRGARRILFVSRFAAVSPNARMRLSGLRHAVAGKRGAVVSAYEFSDGPGGETKLAEFLRAEAPDAVIGSSDMVAAMALKALRAAGLRVPEDVLLAGVNDGPVAKLSDPPLTTVRQPCADIARVAFEALERRRADPSVPAMRIFLHAPLVARESTSPGFLPQDKDPTP